METVNESSGEPHTRGHHKGFNLSGVTAEMRLR